MFLSGHIVYSISDKSLAISGHLTSVYGKFDKTQIQRKDSCGICRKKNEISRMKFAPGMSSYWSVHPSVGARAEGRFSGFDYARLNSRYVKTSTTNKVSADS